MHDLRMQMRQPMCTTFHHAFSMVSLVLAAFAMNNAWRLPRKA
jgi:hypothetical protein